ncbi:bud neck involved protein [Friedmanniomyces endolithicus]|uniref:Bud neck involved protein n=1 Tax=Friedmanniomyces endolithicus TaxID=329885 RepID=A0AAN6L2W4_9PEZI|nr:bud neck involved protein [Friedmanniomyces endolithicus]KAK0796559.1 bud neck involved protein [Friedmanniomyces endolithicus]KAK0821935.1 bud neck involved protein [Friedmanniomyces endolithicus]KAK0867634.1 bud neck involved protein [Friedmanniomyces endolithicus]KAK0928328.1 bud neck involved protein [Friedmanniomyces endolithicus]
MAEVLPPPMQSSSTITMLHPRPPSADAFQTQPQQYPHSPRLVQTPRSMYNSPQNSYRGTSAAPVQPYAFQATPHLRQESRTSSVPTVTQNGPRQAGHIPSPSTSSSDTSSGPSAKDDSVMGSRPGSFINLSSQLPDLSFTSFDSPVKSSPDRYRRPAQKRVDSNNGVVKAPQTGSATPSGPGMGAVSHLYQPPAPVRRQESVDDTAVSKAKESELAKRYRRRSVNTLDTQNLATPQARVGAQRPVSGHYPSATSTPTTIRPVSFQSQTSSDDGKTRPNPTQTSLQRNESSKETIRPQENNTPTPVQKLVNVPARGSSDANKRLTGSSPLSKQTAEAEQSPVKPKTYASVAQAAVAGPPPAQMPSSAAAQLAALSDKDLNHGMKSRLRRAFSFGSAHELRRAAGENNHVAQAAQHAQHTREQHQQKVNDELELDAEQQEIARRQEAAGIGAGIYSGQGGFSGSTDNLSISSTASSASMMLRRMGRGAKKSARSIKGLFRPKSVIGVPAADGPISVGTSAPVQPSMAQVSMVTVEAERHKVNVNAEASETAAGITGFPKLERNSIDAASAAAAPDTRGSADGSDSLSRRSIVGSEKDRAEVLAAVRKGILKRSGTSSPGASPVIKPNDAGLAHVTELVESPASSMPGMPQDGAQLRSTSLNGDYFTPRLVATKSVPSTPGGSKGNISFSPRIQFHDAWSATEYDRRGEIATCNRLTPMLAQQIKEELNTFKMPHRKWKSTSKANRTRTSSDDSIDYASTPLRRLHAQLPRTTRQAPPHARTPIAYYSGGPGRDTGRTTTHLDTSSGAGKRDWEYALLTEDEYEDAQDYQRRINIISTSFWARRRKIFESTDEKFEHWALGILGV